MSRVLNDPSRKTILMKELNDHSVTHKIHMKEFLKFRIKSQVKSRWAFKCDQMKFEESLDQKTRTNIMLNIFKFFNTSNITITHIDMIIARNDEFSYNWENNAKQVMKSSARQKIVKLLKITNTFTLSRAIRAHLTKIVKFSSKSSIQRKKSFDEKKNFHENDHDELRSQKKSATTSSSSA